MEHFNQHFKGIDFLTANKENKIYDPKILIVDDDLMVAEEMARTLRQEGHSVDIALSAEAALQAFTVKTYHLTLIDVFLPGRSTVDLIYLLKEACPHHKILLLIGPAPLQVPPDILSLGNVPCLSKPIPSYVLKKRVHDFLKIKEETPLSRLFSMDKNQGVIWEGIRTRNIKMRDVFEKAHLIAKTDNLLLLTGEHGTGKELLARAIHNQSKRKTGPFLSIQTKSLARDRMFTDLFGIDDRSGPFDHTFRGKLGMGIGGTVFLDELLLLDDPIIHKLQRMIEPTLTSSSQNKTYRGVDIRFILASHKTLSEHNVVKSSHVEFLHRLNPIRIHLPSLRERPEDITPLAYEFLSFFSIHYKKLIGIIPAETRKLLERYHWPGNIRELRHVMEQAVFLSRSAALDPDLLPYCMYNASAGNKIIPIPLGWSLEKAEREIIRKTLEANQKNKKGTAETLGISRRSLYNKLAGYLDEFSPNK